jgi:hypothetical protein
MSMCVTKWPVPFSVDALTIRRQQEIVELLSKYGAEFAEYAESVDTT